MSQEIVTWNWQSQDVTLGTEEFISVVVEVSEDDMNVKEKREWAMEFLTTSIVML